MMQMHVVNWKSVYKAEYTFCPPPYGGFEQMNPIGFQQWTSANRQRGVAFEIFRLGWHRPSSLSDKSKGAHRNVMLNLLPVPARRKALLSQQKSTSTPPAICSRQGVSQEGQCEQRLSRISSLVALFLYKSPSYRPKDKYKSISRVRKLLRRESSLHEHARHHGPGRLPNRLRPLGQGSLPIDDLHEAKVQDSQRRHPSRRHGRGTQSLLQVRRAFDNPVDEVASQLLHDQADHQQHEEDVQRGC